MYKNVTRGHTINHSKNLSQNSIHSLSFQDQFLRKLKSASLQHYPFLSYESKLQIKQQVIAKQKQIQKLKILQQKARKSIQRIKQKGKINLVSKLQTLQEKLRNQPLQMVKMQEAQLNRRVIQDLRYLNKSNIDKSKHIIRLRNKALANQVRNKNLFQQQILDLTASKTVTDVKNKKLQSYLNYKIIQELNRSSELRGKLKLLDDRQKTMKTKLKAIEIEEYKTKLSAQNLFESFGEDSQGVNN